MFVPLGEILNVAAPQQGSSGVSSSRESKRLAAMVRLAKALWTLEIVMVLKRC